MATITRSLSPLAQASATAVTFKQLNLETAPALRPEVIAVIGQASTAKAGSIVANVPVMSDGTPSEAFAKFGASPLFYAAEKLFPLNGDGAKVPVYYIPIEDGTTAAKVDIQFDLTASKSQKLFLLIEETPFSAAADAVGKIATNAQLNPARASRGKKLAGFNMMAVPFNVTAGEYHNSVTAIIKDAVNAEPNLPYTAVFDTEGLLTLTSKWKGVSGSLKARIVTESGDDITIANSGWAPDFTETAGTDSISIADAIAGMTESYGFTRVVNQFDDSANLDRLQAWGEGMRVSLVAQYAIAYYGKAYPESGVLAGTVDVTAVKAIGDARRLDAVNSVIYGTYGELRELDWSQRETLLKAGITNIEIRNGKPTLMDVVTFYHPEGVTNSIYIRDDSITKEGNMAYDLITFLAQEEWESKIIVSVDSKTTNPEAIDVNDFAAAVNGRGELWEKTALIASASFMKANSVYAIDDNNPRRFNANIKAHLTSTASIFDNTLFLGFLFGESA